MVIPGFLLRRIHHRGTEFAEFGEFLNQILFTPRPPRLGGEISEPRFTGKHEDPLSLGPVERSHAGWRLHDLSVRQIQQHTVRIGETLFAELAAFEIFLTRFPFAADGDFSRRGRGGGGGQGVKILFRLR